MPRRTASVALTFEGGGEGTPLPAILEALARSKVRATFFVDGRWAESNPELVRAIGRGGHELGNHGYRHVDWTTMRDLELADDLRATEQLVERFTGSSARPWARPPYGAFDDRVSEVLGRLGYLVVYRDAVDGAHWPGETNADSVLQRALRAAADEGVVAFHTNSALTASALPELLEELERRAFRTVVLSELAPPPTPRTERHPDFEEVEIRPGSVRPRRAGRWQSMNVLELGAARARRTGLYEEVARLPQAALELVTGAGDEPLEWESDSHDRFVLALAGELRCDFRDDEGDLGYLVARPGDLFLCPGGPEYRLGPATPSARRFIAGVWRTAP